MLKKINNSQIKLYLQLVIISYIILISQSINAQEWSDGQKNIFSHSLICEDYAVVGAFFEKQNLVQDAATKSIEDSLIEIIHIGLLAGVNDTVTDVDGNFYKTIKIGSQVWMAENLKVTHFADSTPILKVIYNANWDTLKAIDAAYCWSAAIKACPIGWHLPSNEEWTLLENYLITNGYNYDGSTNGNKIGKSLASQTGWQGSNETLDMGNKPGDVGNVPGSNNKTGFSALPGGYRYNYKCGFYAMGKGANFWSSTAYNSLNAWCRTLYIWDKNLYSHHLNKSLGFNVRCVRD